ncbi:hypothetical protein QBC38DRAFT_361407 [Podospora fimiseda]|uniref:Uncharacterized protein n=1 Tax=Podospora fimiseda TaxID=252190 RepID=A0AAN7BSG5_9PEZI|nr:hypothetical protein QBC38DRAFT_361407 [Podospora fimiseda]
MPRSQDLSNYLAILLSLLNLAFIHAHLTTRFTPSFSKSLRTLLPHHNRTIFWWLGVQDDTLRYIFVSLNATLGILFAVPSFRIIGLKICFGLLFIWFISDLKVKSGWLMHFVVHVVLLGIAGRLFMFVKVSSIFI